jgi:hypothetical protein
VALLLPLLLGGALAARARFFVSEGAALLFLIRFEESFLSEVLDVWHLPRELFVVVELFGLPAFFAMVVSI